MPSRTTKTPVYAQLKAHRDGSVHIQGASDGKILDLKGPFENADAACQAIGALAAQNDWNPTIAGPGVRMTPARHRELKAVAKNLGQH